MKLNIVCRNFELTPSIEAKIEEKASHLKKYFNGKIEVNWVCSLQNHYHVSDVNIHAGHNYFHAEAEDNNLYKTFDGVLGKIERQLRKKNNKLNNKIHGHQKISSIIEH